MKRRREPHRSFAMKAAQRVFAELQLRHPTEVAIEDIAYMRGALVDDVEKLGARANLVKLGNRAVISVAQGLTHEQRRFAVTHEIGHLEVHPKRSYMGLCTDEDLLPSYNDGGHEHEANAFASEFLMPHSLLAKPCDTSDVSWRRIEPIAQEFQVSLTAAAMRFVELCPERVALVCSKDKRVLWTWHGPDFGRRWVERARPLDPYSLAFDFWKDGRVSANRETVSASAWLDDVDDDAELVEHAFAYRSLGWVMSLLWIKADAEW